jgi:hypothetical protein
MDLGNCGPIEEARRLWELERIPTCGEVFSSNLDLLHESFLEKFESGVHVAEAVGLPVLGVVGVDSFSAAQAVNSALALERAAALISAGAQVLPHLVAGAIAFEGGFQMAAAEYAFVGAVAGTCRF